VTSKTAKQRPLVWLTKGSGRPEVFKAGVKVGVDWIAARASSPGPGLFGRPRQRRHPATTKNAAILAKAVGGVALALGPRGHISLYDSEKLSKLEGSVEIRGNAVEMLLLALTVGEAEAILGVLQAFRDKAFRKNMRAKC
jgi:hypothetical protein